MSKTAHTPTPWAVEDPFGPEQYSIVQDGLAAYDWQFIAHVPVGNLVDGEFPRMQAEANAAFIVRAVNSHDALVSALEEAREELRYLMHSSMSDEQIAEELADIDAALSLAAASENTEVAS